MVKTGNLFLIAMLIFSSITLMGCTESNIQVPPFTTGQFVSKATDLNYTNWKNSDYNNQILIIKNDKVSVADANDLNVALPDLSGFVPYQGATADVNLGSHDLKVSNIVLRSDNNLTLTSPNGSKWNCGVDNSGVFSCS